MHSVKQKFPGYLFGARVTKGAAFFESPVLPWLIIGFGITVRCVQYLANRSLWLDESFLALNIIQRNFLQLLQPLDYAQGAPVAFLIAQRAVVQLFGNSEYALRLIPLLSGMISVFLFYKIAEFMLTKRATIIGTMIFAFSNPLIYYSAEVKQYSSDVAMSLLLYFFYSTIYNT